MVKKKVNKKTKTAKQKKAALVRKKEKNEIRKLAFWAPRFLMIVFASMLFAYAKNSPYGKILSIPAAILIVFLIIAWHWEIVGGNIIIALGFVFGIFFEAFKSFNGFMFLILPTWLIGILFWISHKLNKK